MELNRRRLLAVLGTTASSLALAGCSGDDGSDVEEKTSPSDSGDDSSGTSTSDSGDGSSGTSTSDSGDGSSETSTSDSGGDSDVSSDKIEVLSHELVRKYEGEMSESVVIEGKAKNVSDDELSYAQVVVEFYKGDTLAETFLDNINNWSAGKTWAFEVAYPGGFGEEAAEITDYEIVEADTSL
ncbi:FxLYD domain-containing protein [Halovenus rubra]|uniref:FxLYD domain-containing protein n=2 Tax=Halovenus rubra TaxID=869890 RepID=A0ACC7DVW5_9EURY|nr:FxLYD domain-containing protein [Halovenus rubra]